MKNETFQLALGHHTADQVRAKLGSQHKRKHGLVLERIGLKNNRGNCHKKDQNSLSFFMPIFWEE